MSNPVPLNQSHHNPAPVSIFPGTKTQSIVVAGQSIQAPGPLPYVQEIIKPVETTLAGLLNELALLKTGKNTAGKQFSWLQSNDSDPVLLSIDELNSIPQNVFADGEVVFDAKALLEAKIAELSNIFTNIQDDSPSTLQLEGLWIKFPAIAHSESNQARPKLAIAVSIALADSAFQLGPFATNRIYIKFGDS